MAPTLPGFENSEGLFSKANGGSHFVCHFQLLAKRIILTPPKWLMLTSTQGNRNLYVPIWVIINNIYDVPEALIVPSIMLTIYN